VCQHILLDRVRRRLVIVVEPCRHPLLAAYSAHPQRPLPATSSARRPHLP
jgi:hypothetical protein